MAVEEAPTRRQEAAPVPERLGFQEGLVGLQVRLLLSGGALNPNTSVNAIEQATLKRSFGDRAQEAEGTYALSARASINERRTYWQQQEVQGFDAQKQAWVESTAAKFQNHQQYFEQTEKGKSWKRAFARIGINTDHFGPQQTEQLYNAFFTREAQENATQLFVATVLNGYLSPENGTIDYQALHQDLDAWQWMANIYGDQSSQVIAQLTDAEAKLVTPTQRQQLIEQANAQETKEDGQQTTRGNNLRPKERELLTHLWRGGSQTTDETRQTTPRPAPQPPDGSPTAPTNSTPPRKPSAEPQGTEPTPILPPTEEEQRVRGRVRTGEERYIPYESPKDVPEYPVTSEELAEAERWAGKTVGSFQYLYQFRRHNDAESERKYLTRIARKVKQQKELIEQSFPDPLPALDIVGEYQRQTNPGMLTCQIASAINGLRFVNTFNPQQHTEQNFINMLGGQDFVQTHRSGLDTRDLLPVLEKLAPDAQSRWSNSVHEILRSVTNGAAVVVPLSRDHVGTIPPGSRLKRTNGILEVQVADPLSGTGFIPVEYLTKSEITVGELPYSNSVLIIEPTETVRLISDITPDDIAEVEAWRGPAASRDRDYVERVTQKLKDERAAINERYGGHLPDLTTIAEGSWEKQTNPGMYTCQFTAAGNVLRSFGLFDPSKHTEQVFIDTLGGQEYVNNHREGATFYDVEQAIRRFSPEMYPRLTNSMYEILESVEKGEGAIIPVSAGHVAAILPGNRVSRDTSGNLRVQVVDSISGIYNVPIDNLLKSEIILPIDNRSPYNKALILRKENPVRMTRRT